MLLAGRRTRMTRFRCGHCGLRLVMQDRHLRRLVACHGCGRATHPIARRAASAAEPRRAPAVGTPAAPAPRPRDPVSEPRHHVTQPPAPASACANCGDAIGRLQARRDWHGDTVCTPCHARLTLEANPRPAPAPPLAPRIGHRPAGLELSAGPLMPLLLIGATGGAFFVAVSLMSYVGGFVSALVLVAAAAVGLRGLRRGTHSVRDRLAQVDQLRRRHGSLRVLSMLAGWIWLQPLGRKPWACLLVLAWGGLYAPYRLRGMLVPARDARALRVRARAA